VIIAPGEKIFGALLAIAGTVIILTGHWATTDDMIADLIAGLLMVAGGVTVSTPVPSVPANLADRRRLNPITPPTIAP
jgi:hypothetical protein